MNRILQLVAVFLLFFQLFSFAESSIVTFEAESGTIGSDYVVLTDGSVSFVHINTNGTQQFPENANRTVSYNVTFADSGNYILFARMRVGSGNFDDDSFFYSNGFGNKSVTSADDWITVNQLASSGYTVPTDVVYENGGAAYSIWKWVNLSVFSSGDGALIFHVDLDELTKTFQIGAREDGLEFDKFVFAPAGYYYTVSNLDKGEKGSLTLPGTETLGPPLADGLSKFVGCGYGSDSKAGFEEYWNQVVPGNAGKWGSVEGARDVMSWGSLDEAYNFAKKNNFPYRHHVLVWGNQQPSWIESLTASEQLAEIEEWFKAVANRYPAIDFLEVVNEPLHDPPNQPGSGGGNYINALGGTGTTGYDWIIQAFRMARSIFPPTTKLMINEYGLTDNAGNVTNYKKIIALLQGENLIDAVGVQGHAFNTRGTATSMKSNLDMLALVGLPIYITEMDIDGPTDDEQVNSYKKIFPVFWNHPAVRGITLWGFKPGMWRTEQKAYLVNADGTERPALVWLRDFLKDPLSIGEVESEPNFIIYPNPVTRGELMIKGDDEISCVRLYNSDGRMVKSSIFNKQQNISLNLNYAPGIYLIQLIGDHKTTVHKIVVR